MGWVDIFWGEGSWVYVGRVSQGLQGSGRVQREPGTGGEAMMIKRLSLKQVGGSFLANLAKLPK